jgi:magnesium transporter
MRVFLIDEGFKELAGLPPALPEGGYVWIALKRDQLREQVGAVQAGLQAWDYGPLVDLHVSDLLNQQLPSHFDYTSWYDLLVFRRLAAGGVPTSTELETERPTVAVAAETLQAIDTNPVGFAVFDRVLITVHPSDCQVRDFFVARLQHMSEGHAGQRLPASPADLMLRVVNHMVDGYLELRRLLTRQLTALQHDLLGPRQRRIDWRALLVARDTLHQLEDICEDQRSAVQEWIDTLAEWPLADLDAAQRERELLSVRSRDVLEHIGRVLSHVRRLETSLESAVQMHFSALGQRTNDIMRTLTVLTAIFLPLNLITGIFGMNFDVIPLTHSSTGFWVAMVVMLALALSLGGYFWRKRLIGSRGT